MKNTTERQGQSPEENEFDNVLEEILREGRWSGLANMPRRAELSASLRC